jgi:hypothetical protein
LTTKSIDEGDTTMADGHRMTTEEQAREDHVASVH